jgi:hypothetical protein
MSDLATVGEQSPTELRVQALVEEFKATFQRTLVLAIDLGHALEDHKATMPHGAWLPWIRQSFELGDRMADNCMDLARNSQRVANLPPDTSIRAALKWLRDQRQEPRPVPTPNGVVAAAPTLYRYMIDATSAQVVRAILATCFPDTRDVLDVTYGNGAFWDGHWGGLVTGRDLLPSRGLHGTNDVRALTDADEEFGVVVFDPPHLADGGADSIMADRFGSIKGEEDLKDLFIQGTRECWRVASLGIIVKVCDHVHGQALVQETDWVDEAMHYGWPYEVVHQVRSTTVKDPRWGDPLSAYTNGSTYMVWRKDGHVHRRR